MYIMLVSNAVIGDSVYPEIIHTIYYYFGTQRTDSSISENFRIAVFQNSLS